MTESTPEKIYEFAERVESVIGKLVALPAAIVTGIAIIGMFLNPDDPDWGFLKVAVSIAPLVFGAFFFWVGASARNVVWRIFCLATGLGLLAFATSNLVEGAFDNPDPSARLDRQLWKRQAAELERLHAADMDDLRRKYCRASKHRDEQFDCNFRIDNIEAVLEAEGLLHIRESFCTKIIELTGETTWDCGRSKKVQNIITIIADVRSADRLNKMGRCERLACDWRRYESGRGRVCDTRDWESADFVSDGSTYLGSEGRLYCCTPGKPLQRKDGRWSCVVPSSLSQ